MTTRSFKGILVVLVWALTAMPVHAMPPPGCHLVFDGIDDRMPAGSIGWGTITQWTLSAWIRTTSTDSVQAIISRGEDVFLDVLPWAMGTLATGQVYVQIEPDNNGSSFVCLSNTLVADGEWHFVVTRRNQSNVVTIYIDDFMNAPDATCTDAPTTLPTLQTSVGVGFSHQADGAPTNPQPPALFFDGSIDEPAFWRVPLTQAEIETLRTNGPLGIQDDHLVAYWPLDEGSGQTAASYMGDLINGLSELGGGIPGTLGDSSGVDPFDPTWACSGVPAMGTTGRWLLIAFALALGVYPLRGWRRSLRV